MTFNCRVRSLKLFVKSVGLSSFAKFPESKIHTTHPFYNLLTGLQSRLCLLLHWPLQQPDLGHHLQQLFGPEQREHPGRAQWGGQHGIPIRQQHAHQQRVHRHEPGQCRPRDPQGGHAVCSGPHQQRQNRRIREVNVQTCYTGCAAFVNAQLACLSLEHLSGLNQP